MAPLTVAAPPKNVFDTKDDFDDDDGWQDMPIVRDEDLKCDLDEEDKRKYHYQSSGASTLRASTSSNATGARGGGNATGSLIDFDDEGNEWRSKIESNEREYTRLRVREEDDADEVHLRTKYLFDEDKAMTPLSQMQATKNLLTEAQRIAYVGVCSLTSREMLQSLKTTKRKELKKAAESMELWMLKIMGRLYYHMELETQEQKMIESLGEHGVLAMDLVPPLMTTHKVANPEYDPEEAQRQAEEESDSDNESISDQTLVNEPLPKSGSDSPRLTVFEDGETLSQPNKTVQKVLKESEQSTLQGVTTTLSAADKDVTLDIRWTVLCDLFLVLIADSVYDARSRVLLENVASKLGLGWLDVVKFESRVTEALEIQEDVESLEQQEIVDGVRVKGKKRRYMMMGLATIGGGLVIGLSAGLLAPVIGVGLAGALGTIGIGGTGAFLGGTAGAAVITTGGVLTGSGIAVKGMAKRTQEVRTFEILPLHNNKRVNCILTVPGFMTSTNDDVRLPFSVLDPIVGDVFSVLWEPEMIRETGSALKILTGEVLSQIGMTVLSATIMTGLVSALQWPIILTKLGYLIDNPWSNALDRAKTAGKVLANVLLQRHLGVRPITLIGFSLGARVIYYALLELSAQKAYGIVQDVFLLGTTVTMPLSSWLETRSVISGRYVNAYARNDWVLNYLFRATAGGVGTVAGLRPVEGVPGLENVDVTDKISGHMSYRTFMPLILDQLGFPVFSDYFDEPVEPDFEGDRVVIQEEETTKTKTGWFGRKSSTDNKRQSTQGVSRPPSVASWAKPSQGPPTVAGMASTTSAAGTATASGDKAVSKDMDGDDDEDLPPRMEVAHSSSAASSSPQPATSSSPADAPSGRTTPTPASTSSTKANSASDSTSSLPRPLDLSNNSSTETINTSSQYQDKDDKLPQAKAGFDLAAIQEAVIDVEKSPTGLKESSIAAAAGWGHSNSAAYGGGWGGSAVSGSSGSGVYGGHGFGASTSSLSESGAGADWGTAGSSSAWGGPSAWGATPSAAGTTNSHAGGAASSTARISDRLAAVDIARPSSTPPAHNNGLGGGWGGESDIGLGGGGWGGNASAFSGGFGGGYGSSSSSGGVGSGSMSSGSGNKAGSSFDYEGTSSMKDRVRSFTSNIPSLSVRDANPFGGGQRSVSTSFASTSTFGGSKTEEPPIPPTAIAATSSTPSGFGGGWGSSAISSYAPVLASTAATYAPAAISAASSYAPSALNAASSYAASTGTTSGAAASAMLSFAAKNPEAAGKAVKFAADNYESVFAVAGAAASSGSSSSQGTASRSYLDTARGAFMNGFGRGGNCGASSAAGGNNGGGLSFGGADGSITSSSSSTAASGPSISDPWSVSASALGSLGSRLPPLKRNGTNESGFGSSNPWS